MSEEVKPEGGRDEQLKKFLDLCTVASIICATGIVAITLYEALNNRPPQPPPANRFVLLRFDGSPATQNGGEVRPMYGVPDSTESEAVAHDDTDSAAGF